MTIDEDVARQLEKKRVSGEGKTFKEAVNETLRNGLKFEEQLKAKPRRKFELKGRLLRSKMLFNFNQVSRLVESVENDPALK